MFISKSSSNTNFEIKYYGRPESAFNFPVWCAGEAGYRLFYTSKAWTDVDDLAAHGCPVT